MFKQLSTTTLLCLSATLLSGAHAHGKSQTDVYVASLTPLGDSGVTGSVVVFVPHGSDTVGYAGSGMGLEMNLGAEQCTAKNGCGVHIHSGMDCMNTTTQGGHFFDDPVMEDPWTEDRYTSDANGEASFSGVVTIGTDYVAGRAFLIHAADGSRVACGILKFRTEDPDVSLLTSNTDELSTSGVSSSVTLVTGVGGKDDKICFFGKATGLEPDLQSHLVTPGGSDGDVSAEARAEEGDGDCKEANGCGAHVHGGMDCTDKDTQGGHFYNKETLTEDPWALVGYETTNTNGMAYFVDCVETGETEFNGKLFIVHANDGSRVSCGSIESDEVEEDGGDGDSSAFSMLGKSGLVLAVLSAVSSIFM